MLKFPMKFEVTSTATSGILSQWTAQADSLPPIPSAIPPEFSGPGGGYSPEDLFGIAILNCLISMYKVYCEKSKITFKSIEGKAIVVVDKSPSEPSFVVTEVNFYIDVAGVSHQEKAKSLFDQAAKDCPLGNSIKAGKTFHINIS